MADDNNVTRLKADVVVNRRVAGVWCRRTDESSTTAKSPCVL